MTDNRYEVIEAIPFVASETEATKIMAQLSLSNKTLYYLFKPHLDKKAEPLVAELLYHVAFGEKNEVEEMLKKYPGLLYKTGVTQDPCGRTIEGTAYRIALGAKDVSIGEHKEMVEMINRYLKQLPNGKEELEKQYAEQFPKGYEKQEEMRRKSDSAALRKVFAAIGKSNNDEDCEEAIEEFKNYLKKQTEGVITTGYHFNDRLFLEALKLYDDNYVKFGGCATRKNNLAAIKVGAVIERYFPACLAQAACNGFHKVLDEKKFGHVLFLSDTEKTPFYHPKLGETHFLYSYDEASIHDYASLSCFSNPVVISEFMSSKNSALEKLMPRPRKEPARCIVC